MFVKLLLMFLLRNNINIQSVRKMPLFGSKDDFNKLTKNILNYFVGSTSQYRFADAELKY